MLLWANGAGAMQSQVKTRAWKQLFLDLIPRGGQGGLEVLGYRMAISGTAQGGIFPAACACDSGSDMPVSALLTSPRTRWVFVSGDRAHGASPSVCDTPPFILPSRSSPTTSTQLLPSGKSPAFPFLYVGPRRAFWVLREVSKMFSSFVQGAGRSLASVTLDGVTRSPTFPWAPECDSGASPCVSGLQVPLWNPRAALLPS